MGDGCARSVNSAKDSLSPAHQEDGLLERELLHAALDDARIESDNSGLYGRCQVEAARSI